MALNAERERGRQTDGVREGNRQSDRQTKKETDRGGQKQSRMLGHTMLNV